MKNSRVLCSAVFGAVASTSNFLVAADESICNSIHQMQCHGDDIKDFGAVTTHNECCDACKQTEGCNAWTWNWNEDGHCWLKRSCGHSTEAYGYHSGMKVNHLNIVPNAVRKRNFFLIIGDYGHEGGPNGCTTKVAEKMKGYARTKIDQGNTLLFVAAVGDNFYSRGLSDTSEWDKVWANVYGVNDPSSGLYGIQWFGIMGNHDLGGSDPGCACGKTCNQIGTSPDLFYMPYYYWSYYIPGIELEIIGLDTNYLDVNGLGGDGCNGHSPEVCNTCGWNGEVNSFLNQIGDEGKSMMDSRAEVTAAQVTVIMQHYNPDGNGFIGQVLKQRYEEKNQGKAKVMSVYGHRHEQACEGSRTYGCDLILTGGGGGWRGGTYFGFTAVWLEDDGSYWADVDSDEVRFLQSDCTWWGSGATQENSSAVVMPEEVEV